MFERSRLLLIALALGCSTQKTPAPMHNDAAAPTPVASSACKSDADCELVDETCCNCNEGGRRIAVLRGHAPKRDCSGIMCPQFVSHDPTCLPQTRAYCKAGKCETSAVNDQNLRNDPLQEIK